jgi:hypothetical protein
MEIRMRAGRATILASDASGYVMDRFVQGEMLLCNIGCGGFAAGCCRTSGAGPAVTKWPNQGLAGVAGRFVIVACVASTASGTGRAVGCRATATTSDGTCTAAARQPVIRSISWPMATE